ncbi:MAG TPA: hypothetical protein VGM62_19780 [Chthoniobacterales bacterium]|jgi:hypothetical protein
MRIQFHICDAAQAQAADKTKVAQILKLAADKFAMLDTTVTSRVVDTISCYSGDRNDQFASGARIVGDRIIVDLSDSKKGSNTFPVFNAHIASELDREFGDRVKLANDVSYIEARGTLPVSEAAKEYARAWFRNRED